ncbi:MAG: hypothetical protein ACRYFW_15090 [Janthinobacterium lividum]
MKTRIVAAAVACLAGGPVLAQQAPVGTRPYPAAQPGGPPPAAGAPMRGGGRMGGGAAMLRMADANGDGVVTRAEYLAAVDARFDRMDANHDGVLSPDEMPMRGGWRGGMGGDRDRQRGDVPPPPPPAGSSPDATGTPPAPPAVQSRPPETRDQYRAGAMRRFDRLDANHDGRIDPAEMAAWTPPGGMRRGSAGDAPPPPADQ